MNLYIKQYSNTLKVFLLFFVTLLFFKFSYAQEVKTTKTKNSKSVTRVLYGTASFYSNKFDGRKTANGEIFRQSKFTAACNVLPLGTWVKVTNLRNGKTVTVKTNDRLHPKMTRILDLSRAAAVKLDFVDAGLTRVKVEVLGKKQPK
jgi:rare lipoprotein A